MRFRSKIDTWFIVVLIVTGVAAVLGCIPFVTGGGPLAFAKAAIIHLANSAFADSQTRRPGFDDPSRLSR